MQQSCGHSVNPGEIFFGFDGLPYKVVLLMLLSNEFSFKSLRRLAVAYMAR